MVYMLLGQLGSLQGVFELSDRFSPVEIAAVLVEEPFQPAEE